MQSWRSLVAAKFIPISYVKKPALCPEPQFINKDEEATLSQVSHPQAITSIQTQSLNMRELHFFSGELAPPAPRRIVVGAEAPTQPLVPEDDSFV